MTADGYRLISGVMECSRIGVIFAQLCDHCESEVKVTQSCPSLCDPMDYTAHGILQTRTREWVSFPLSRGSSQPRDQSQVSRIHCRQILYQLSHQGSPRILEWVAYPFSSGSSRPGSKPGSPALQWVFFCFVLFCFSDSIKTIKLNTLFFLQ